MGGIEENKFIGRAVEVLFKNKSNFLERDAGLKSFRIVQSSFVTHEAA
jgi:hypothetical protein